MIPAPPPSTPVLDSNGALTTDWYHYLAQDNRPVVNIQDFGARGDGVADDTAALAKAIGAVEGTGKVLLLYPGTYMVSRDVLRIANAGATIVGPRDAIIKNADGDGVTLEVRASNVTLSGFTIDGGNPNSTVADGYRDTHRSFYISGPDNSTYISNIVIDGITSANSGYGGIELFYCQNSYVRNCYVYRCGYVGIGLASVTNCQVSNNYITNIFPGSVPGALDSDCYGCYVSRNTSDPASDSVWVTNNYVSNVTWEGLDEHDSQRVFFLGNEIYNCGTGIAVEHHRAGYPASGITVADNYIYGRGSGQTIEGVNYTSIGGILCKGGVNTEQGQQLIVANNQVLNAGDARATSGNGAGIAVTNFRGVTVSGNYCYFNYKYGILLYDDGTDSVLYLNAFGNTVDSTQANAGVQSDFFCTERVMALVTGGFSVGSGDGHSQAASPTYVTHFVGCRDE